MGLLAGLVDPIFLFLALGVEITIFEDRQPVFPADFIGDFTQFLVVADFVLELYAVLEGHWIHNKVAMHIVGVQVDGNEYRSPYIFLAVSLPMANACSGVASPSRKL